MTTFGKNYILFETYIYLKWHYIYWNLVKPWKMILFLFVYPYLAHQFRQKNSNYMYHFRNTLSHCCYSIIYMNYYGSVKPEYINVPVVSVLWIFADDLALLLLVTASPWYSCHLIIVWLGLVIFIPIDILDLKVYSGIV